MEAARGLQPYRMYDRKQSKACRRHGSSQRLAGDLEETRGLQEIWKKPEPCRRYGSIQRLAGGIEAGRGLLEVWKQAEACRRYRSSQRLAGDMEAARGFHEVCKQSTTYDFPISLGELQGTKRHIEL